MAKSTSLDDFDNLFGKQITHLLGYISNVTLIDIDKAQEGKEESWRYLGLTSEEWKS